jgi:hypothetical protein
VTLLDDALDLSAYYRRAELLFTAPTAATSTTTRSAG